MAIQTWINAKEELPADGQVVWTFRPANKKYHFFNDEISVHKYHKDYLGDAWWMHREAYGNNYLLEMEQVTHWMLFMCPDSPGGKQEALMQRLAQYSTFGNSGLPTINMTRSEIGIAVSLIRQGLASRSVDVPKEYVHYKLTEAGKKQIEA